jgi:lysozyme family protein
MIMNKYERQQINFVLSLEGGVADLVGDSGGWTYKGLSSKYYPHIKEMYDRNDPNLDDYVDSVYLNDYLRAIYGYDQLVEHAEWLVSLLFPAKVHGSGDEDFISVVQDYLSLTGFITKIDGFLGPDTLEGILALSTEDLGGLQEYVLSKRDWLIESRVRSVGGYHRGIANRVLRTLENALGNANVYANLSGVDPGPTSDISKAKLSMIVGSDGKVHLDASGWEDLPLSLDLTVEIRSKDHASHSISTKRSLLT